MAFWLVNHSWDSFKRTQEYCGFQTSFERDKIRVGDKIVYFGNSLVLGLFEAIALPNNEFKDWRKPYHYQVKLKSIMLSKDGLLAKQLESKIKLQKIDGSSTNIVELTENEFNQIKQAIENGKKELKFA